MINGKTYSQRLLSPFLVMRWTHLRCTDVHQMRNLYISIFCEWCMYILGRLHTISDPSGMPGISTKCPRMSVVMKRFVSTWEPLYELCSCCEGSCIYLCSFHLIVILTAAALCLFLVHKMKCEMCCWIQNESYNFFFFIFQLPK